MNKYISIFILALVALFMASCERRPLVEVSNTHYVRVYIDEAIRNVTYGFYNSEYARPVHKAPDVMRVALADKLTGQIKAERFLRNKSKDEKGTYYDGYIIADPGEYNLVTYNFDTETSIVNEAADIEDSKAFTNEIASHLRAKISSRGDAELSGDEKIVYEPDHLFTTSCGEVSIPYSESADTILPNDGGYFMAKSVVKSYYLQVKVKGIEYAASTVGLLTGLSGSCRLIDGTIDTSDSITVYFEMNPNATQSVGMEYSSGIENAGSDSTVILYTTFNTFGKIPDLKNKLQITFDFITVYGKSYSETFDITPAFHTPEGINNQWLLIDRIIEIPAPPPVTGSGGFKPVVDDWGDINEDINI